MPTRRAAQQLPLFPNAKAFREWLAKNARTADALLMGYDKVATGKPSLTWPESVDEALCVGWIDGVRRRIDEASYSIRFTPRRQGSIWSAVNVVRVAALTAQGRTQPAGVAAFERRTERKTSVYAYEQRDSAALNAHELVAFKRNTAAWQFFEKAAPSYRKVMLYWIVSARKPETRARRLAQLIDASGAGRKLLK